MAYRSVHLILRLAINFVAILVLVTGVVVDTDAAGGPKDIVLVLDNSGSMKKNDPGFLTNVAVREFLDRLEGDNRVAILLFDQDTRLEMPLTPLTEATRPDFLLSLDKVNYRGLLTDSPAAIERAIYELKVNGRPDADKSIVFMTDGIVDTGDKAMDVEKSRWLREELSSEAADENIRIFGIAFTENADFFLIQSLSKRTSGEYFRAYSASDINGVFRRVVEVLDKPKVPDVAQTAPEIAQPAPLTALPEITQPEPDTGVTTPLPELPDTGFPTAGEGTPASETAEPALPSLPEPATTESTAPGELPTLPLPQLDTTSEAQVTGEPAAGATTSPDTAPADAGQQPPEPAAQTPEPSPPQPPAPVPAPAPQPSLQLPILIAIGAGVLVLLIAVVYLVKRKTAMRAPVEEQIPKAFLNDLGGVSQQQSYELNDRLTVIGRLAGSDADTVNYVVIPEPTIGRRHAMIEFKDHSFWVIDQNSLNGTFVNNKRIDSDTRLKHGDRVRFHKHEFEFLLLDMFETDRTMMSNTMFAGISDEIEDQDVTRARPGAEEAEDPEKTTATNPEPR